MTSPLEFTREAKLGKNRRKHKNSKNGCINCKKRRVKCSEDLPACLNCIKHKVTCSYLSYTEQQLQEIRLAKALNAEDSDDTKPIKTSPGKGRNDSASPRSAPPSESVSVADLNVDLRYVYFATPAPALLRTLSPPGVSLGVIPTLQYWPAASQGKGHASELPHTFPCAGPDYHDNHAHLINNESSSQLDEREITQDYDNLLHPTSDGPERTIIYPVYSISDRAMRDHLSPPPLPPTYIKPKVQAAPPGVRQARRTLLRTSSYPRPHSTNSLPGALHEPRSFRCVGLAKVNYISLMLSNIVKTGPRINSGTISLEEIRSFYWSWINSFIYRLHDSPLMFSCLINFSTNYLLSNNLHGLLSITNRSRLKNALIVILVRNYGIVIKLLREALNTANNPELCLSVSYILSLMSIYDPEATLHSINCFRDGLFGVLSHHLHLARKYSHPPTILIPAYLRFMKNIERSVYYPGYDPTCLLEFQEVLVSFDAITQWHVACQARSSEDASSRRADFLFGKYNDLCQFMSDTLSVYLPQINYNLDNLALQQQVLFEMLYRWVRFWPSRFLMINASTHPLEKILALFYKALQKMLYAILPQIKFFFLRDLELPLMMAVMDVNDDYNIFDHELDQYVCSGDDLPDELYRTRLGQFKEMVAYLIRLSLYFQRRTTILYRFTMAEEPSQRQFPIDDIKTWMKLIDSIKRAQQEFSYAVGFQEQCIQRFKFTLIQAQHYPSINHDALVDNELQPVDFGSLQPNGLVKGDADPFNPNF